MDKLLQELWDQFCALLDEIDDIVADNPLDKEPYISLDMITSDTEEMAKLRQKLFDVGIQRIAGFRYSDKKQA